MMFVIVHADSVSNYKPAYPPTCLDLATYLPGHPEATYLHTCRSTFLHTYRITQTYVHTYI